MKKLFFTALVAIVAVGGAYAQYVSTPGATSPQFNCSGTATPLCTYPIYPAGSTEPIPADSDVYDQTKI